MLHFKNIILILMVIATLFGCDDKFQTSHPNEGGIVLMMDWSDVKTEIPPVYQARVIQSTGFIRDFDGLIGETNMLLVEPGEVSLYVYNNAENILVSSNKAIVRSRNGNFLSNPGAFFSGYQQVSTEADSETPLTVRMSQQTGELKLALAVKPAEMIDKIKTINVTLEGVSTELDMQTNELSGSAAVNTDLSQTGFYATSSLFLFGFDKSVSQRITIDVELKNGAHASSTTDASSLFANFNSSKNSPFTLSADLNISGENSPVISVNNWQQNAEMRYLSVFPPDIEFNQSQSQYNVSIFTDQPSWTFDVAQSGRWLTVTQEDDILAIEVSPNTDDSPRQATITISAGTLYENINVTQKATGPYDDMEVVVLQRATVGKGVDIILMGDGYTVNDMDRGTGKYERDMRTATDHFFSVYPYSAYRNYFNVYMIAAISKESGISNTLTGKKVNTVFEAEWEGGRSTRITSNENIVVEYLQTMRELDDAYIDDITVIMPINANIYAGTCVMFYQQENADFGNGFSICMCPVGSAFQQIVVHEGAGHGFAKLMDEYYDSEEFYHPNETIPAEDKANVLELKKWGWAENIDFFANITQTTWRGFAGNANYPMVGTFEGGYLYGKGVWRPEFNSCMNDNTFYFNAPSRWATVRRIMRLAGVNYSFAQFLRDDRIPVYPTTTRSDASTDFVPLAPPVIKRLR
ncbi:MAG: hypothetical protein LBE56_05155 [Tannerella sp.]|nr:hypothetical protein [Tannerella sp.]